MPVIYKDLDFDLNLDLNVATNYVPATLTVLHLNTLSPHGATSPEVMEEPLENVLALDERREHQSVARVLLWGRRRAISKH